VASIHELSTLQEIAIEARHRLAPMVWDALIGGSDSETTLKRNRWALDSIAFRPRVMVDVLTIDASTSFLGQPLRIPVMCAPIGSLHLYDPGAAATVIRAAHRFGTLPIISTVASPGVEEAAKVTDGAKIFQLYVRGDRRWCDDLLDKVVAGGYVSLTVTVDVAYYSRRERDLISKFERRKFVARSNIGNVSEREEFNHQAQLVWDFLDYCRDRTRLPIILKGVATAEDAKLAVEHGVAAVYVSNHGGRQLDHGAGTMEILPEIVAAVAGRAEIVVDGGFMRGTDVIKAIAMGAKAVGIGKLQGLALAAGGEDGLVKTLELLEREMIVGMGLLGVTSLSQLGPQHLRPAVPMNPPHPLSPFPVFLDTFGPGGLGGGH
jgi:glycolate oxidase